MNLLRFLLFPFAALYGIVVLFRNQLYTIGILSSKEFKTSMIAIGNLSAGGTGKSPMTEYLICMLKDKLSVAVLSRGYKRHTDGFLTVEKDSTSFQIGDEPLQFKKKFPDVIVSVDENRKRGIKMLLSQFPELKVILLDDAFQHRSVKAGLNILLTDYSNMFYDDFLLPVGSLREWRSGKKRADIIITTKCPYNLTPVEKRIILKKISPELHQRIFFSHIKYGEPITVFPSPGERGGGRWDVVLLLTGVSNPQPLENYLVNNGSKVIPARYPDHHEYTIVEAMQLVETFNKISSINKVIITTEKDAMRLDKPGLVEVLHKLPLYYIPIEIVFAEKDREEFDQMVNNYVVRTTPKN